jgi:L-arabinokinase
LDSGAIQQGPLCIDGHVTLDKYYQNIHQNHEELLRNEIKFLQENHIDLVITDATPIACRAGSESGCKVLILSNFTWDRMYSGMLLEIQETLEEETIQKYHEMIDECAHDYSFANSYLQLPGAVPLPAHMETSKHSFGPLIGRNSIRTRHEILCQYSLDSLQFQHILLIGFGGHDVPWEILQNPSSLPLPDGWICLILGGTQSSSSFPNSSSSSRVVSIPYQCYVPDLISISSVVLGKLGYGFMSECLSHEVPMLYMTRSCWPEEIYLKNYMTNYRTHTAAAEDLIPIPGAEERVNCLEMKYEDFVNGNWEEYLVKCTQYREGWIRDEDQEKKRIRVRQEQQREKLAEIYEVVTTLQSESGNAERPEK